MSELSFMEKLLDGIEVGLKTLGEIGEVLRHTLIKPSKSVNMPVKMVLHSMRHCPK